MSFEPDQGDFAGVCPYLGLADDADSHATYATEAHRCYRLPNPTRIASGHQESYCLGSNHTTCPVFQGEGVPRPVTAGADPAVAARPAREERPAATGGSPFGRSTEPRGAKGTVAGPTGGLPRARRPGEPRLNPSPRGGGINMGVATIGLFVAAIVVIGIAIGIQHLVGGDDGGSQIPGVATKATTPTVAGAATLTAAATANKTVTGSTTPGANTTPTAGAAEKSYTVVSGDLCTTIADAHNLTLDQFFTLNPTIDRGCQNLQVGQVVTVAQ